MSAPDFGPIAARIDRLREAVAAGTGVIEVERSLLAEMLGDLAEDVAELEDFQKLRAASGVVVRLRPALALIEGGRNA